MADTIGGNLLKYLGLVGTSGMNSGLLVPRAATPASNERLFSDFERAGDVADPDVWTRYASLMARGSTSFGEMLRLWSEMAEWDLMKAAMVQIVDEATQVDTNSPGVVWYQCNDREFEEELNDMLVRVQCEDLIQSQIWHVASLGNHFEKLEYAPQEGIISMSFVHPMDIRRYWLERNHRCIGFKWTGHDPKSFKEAAFVAPDNQTPIERVSMSNGKDLEELWYPWDFCFSADTKISLLDGREVSLEDLQKEVGTGEFWVYSSKPDGRIVPGRAHSLKLTRQAAEIVEVEIDNGEKIKCTPDHQFMLRDGTYREASKLQPGDSLMPLYRKLSTVEEHDRKDYEMFFDNAAERWRFTHWRVAETVYGTPRGKNGRFNTGYHVHHVNFQKRVNDPKNLKWMTVAEHNKVHTDLNRSPEHKARARAARSATLKHLWATKREFMMANVLKRARSPEGRARSKANALALHERRKIDPALDKKFKDAVHQNGIKLRDYCAERKFQSQPSQKAISRQNALKINQRRKTDPEFVQRLREISRQNGTALGLRRKLDPALDQKIREATRQNGLKNAAAVNARRKADPEFDASVHLAQRNAAIERIATGQLKKDPATGYFYNHKVVAVKSAGTSDVYDFEVDDQHNFALSAGVFVHNCHFRRIFRLRHTQHGEPIFEEAQGIYKKLRMAIDQMVVHRAQVQPDRYSINIDVQEQPPIEQMKTVQRWKQALRSKLAFGQGNGSTTNGLGNPTDFTSYYNAWGLDTILYVAQPKGFQHAITKIPGTAQVPDVYDIELLTDLFYSIIGMPRSWFGGSKDSQEAPSGKSLLAQDIRFLRKVKSIRHPIVQGYTWLGYFHAVLKGKDVKQLDIKAMMPPIGGLEEQMKLEMLKMQSEVMSELADVMAKYRLPKEAWVETIFKRYMHLPDDVLNVFLTALPLPVDGADAMERTESQRPAPAEYKIIREVEAAVARIPRLQYAVNSLKHGRYMSINEAAQKRVRSKTYADPKRVMHMPEMKDFDIVINSMGEHPMHFEKSESMGAPAKRSAMPLTEAMTAARKGLSPLIPLQETVQANGSVPTSTQEAYRRYMPDKY